MEAAVFSDKEEIIREAKAMLERGTSLYTVLEYTRSHIFAAKPVGASGRKDAILMQGHLVRKNNHGDLNAKEAVDQYADYLGEL